MLAFYALMCCVGLVHLTIDLLRTVAAYAEGGPVELDSEES